MHNVWAERWTEKGHVGHFWNVGPPAPHLQTKPFPPENAETAQSLYDQIRVPVPRKEPFKSLGKEG